MKARHNTPIVYVDAPTTMTSWSQFESVNTTTTSVVAYSDTPKEKHYNWNVIRYWFGWIIFVLMFVVLVNSIGPTPRIDKDRDKDEK